MHLLFYGKEEVKLLGNRRIEDVLKEQSVKVLKSFVLWKRMSHSSFSKDESSTKPSLQNLSEHS